VVVAKLGEHLRFVPGTERVVVEQLDGDNFVGVKVVGLERLSLGVARGVAQAPDDLVAAGYNVAQVGHAATVRSKAMRTIGLAVEMKDSRPTLSVVALDDGDGSPVLAGWFELTSADEDLATQLHALHASVVTRIKDLMPADRAVVRRADASPPGVGAKEPVKLRLIAEGTVIAAVRECLTDVRVAAGVDLGRWYRSNKATLDADALALVESAGILRLVGERKRVAQAVGAALGSLSAP